MNALVVANGTLPDTELLDPLLQGADLVVAADGGADLLLSRGLRLDAIVGDMDSVAPALLRQWQAGGGETVLALAEKDETDLELAVRHALARGAGRLTILGALGGRADHTMANLLLLAAPLLAPVSAIILDPYTRIVAVRDSATIEGLPGDLVSLLPIGGPVDGIETEGLRYPLRGETLPLGTPRGVSNVLIGDRARVSLRHGILLAFHTWPEARPLAWGPSPRDQASAPRA